MARVVIVDPEPDLLLLAIEAVTELGHEAVVLEESEQHAHADVLMIAPCQEMRSVVARLRASCHGMSVILVSVRPSSDDMHALRPAQYLAKPYTLDALDRALDSALAAKDPA